MTGLLPGLDAGVRSFQVILDAVFGGGHPEENGGQVEKGQGPQDDQGAWLQVSEEIEQQPALGVEHQNVAPPDQVGVNQPDHEQPEYASKIDAANASAASFGPLIHQDQPRAEEHREDGHHLGFEDQMIEEPDHAIEAFKASAAHRVAVRSARPGEPDDVHRQNAQKREAAEHVDGIVSLRACDRLGARLRLGLLRDVRRLFQCRRREARLGVEDRRFHLGRLGRCIR